jgi:hypothetical protein
MDSLARLLTVASGYDVHDGDPDDLDTLEARQFLRGLARVLQDEDLVEEIAKRLHDHNHPAPWEVSPPNIRNQSIFKTLDVLDALRDLITEELS